MFEISTSTEEFLYGTKLLIQCPKTNFMTSMLLQEENILAVMHITTQKERHCTASSK
jgi:hypothetical protein